MNFGQKLHVIKWLSMMTTFGRKSVVYCISQLRIHFTNFHIINKNYDILNSSLHPSAKIIDSQNFLIALNRLVIFIEYFMSAL